MNMRSLSKADRTRVKLLDAVEALSSQGPMSAITMRSIAHEAGCSLGLAYRYFDTKEQLLGAVLDRATAHITDGLSPSHTPEELVEHAWPRLARRPVFARLFAWLILEQQDVSAVMTQHPLLDSAIRQANEAGDPDPIAAATALGAILLGGGFFGPAITNAAQGQPNSPELRNRLTRAAGATQLRSTLRP